MTLPISEELVCLEEALRADEELLWVWHCNTAIPIHDSGIEIEAANFAATRVLQHLFHVDSAPLHRKYRPTDFGEPK